MCAIVPAIATGLGLFQGLAMRNAAKQQAQQTAQTEYANIRSQEDAKNLKVTTAGQNLKDKDAANARKAQKASLATRQKVGAVQASGIAGNLLATLTGEQEREGANIRNNLDISRNIINQFKKMLETKFGQVIIWKGEDEEIVAQWLRRHSKEYILKNIVSTLDWRRSKEMDGIKRITYFHKKFMESAGPKSKKEQLDQILGKFNSTHKIKW